jgi:hypothetical protein
MPTLGTIYMIESEDLGERFWEVTHIDAERVLVTSVTGSERNFSELIHPLPVHGYALLAFLELYKEQLSTITSIVENIDQTAEEMLETLTSIKAPSTVRKAQSAPPRTQLMQRLLGNGGRRIGRYQGEIY